MENKSRTILYSLIYILLSGLFLKALYSNVNNSVFTHDLLQAAPTIARETAGLPFLELFGYLLRPWPMSLAMASLKLYIYLVLLLFGPICKYLVFSAILFHFGNSILLFLLSRKLGLSIRAGFLSCIMYLTLFAHLHAWFWPIAFQHLVAVSAILLGLNLYLATDRLISAGGNYRPMLTFTLLTNILLSFCRISVIIVPAAIFAHILFCSKDSEDRLKKYTLWTPLFIIYLAYPLFVVCSGDQRFIALGRPIISFLTNNAVLNTVIFKMPLLLKFSIMFLTGAACLFTFRLLIVAYQKYNLKKVSKRGLLIIFIIAISFIIYTGGIRRLLLPYNMLVPFVGILASFIAPVQNALSMNSTWCFHFIPLQLNVFNFFLSIFILTLFIKIFLHRDRNKTLVICAVFYLLQMFQLYLWNPVASRYFIYLSPLFCIIFCAGADYICDYLTAKIKLPGYIKEGVVLFVFLGLCISNLFAIKLSLFRENFANTFYTYDYTRAAGLIKRDILRKDRLDLVNRNGIYVSNIQPIEWSSIDTFPDSQNDNARSIFKQAFNNAHLDIRLNQESSAGREPFYYVLNSSFINDERGANIDPFGQYFETAIEEMKAGRYKEALPSFEDALRERPYILNYILGGLKIEDLEWVTQKGSLRAWVQKIAALFCESRDNPKEYSRSVYLSDIITQEMDRYIEALFYASFLKHNSGMMSEGRYWLSRIGFFENNYKDLQTLIMRRPFYKSDNTIEVFLNSVDDTMLYPRFDNYSDRYKFEKFLFRLALERR